MTLQALKKSLDPKIQSKKELIGARTLYKFTMKLPPHPDFQDLPARFSQLYTKTRFAETGVTITISPNRQSGDTGGDNHGVPRFMSERQWSEFTIDPASSGLIAKAVYRLVDDCMLQMSMDFMNWRMRPLRGDPGRTNGEWLDAVRAQKAMVAGQPSQSDVDAFIAETTGKDPSTIARNTRAKLRNAARKAMAHA